MSLWFNPNAGSFDEHEDAIYDLASAPGQPVYAVLYGRIVTILPDGSRTPFFTSEPSVGAITVASTGRVFFRTSDDLAVISAAGALETTHALPGATGIIAVASDSCTIYYEKAGSIGRINGCTGAVLSDFATKPIFFTDLYPLPNGDVLIATGTEIVLHNSSGTVVRTVASFATYGIDIDGFHHFGQVAASADGQILYVAVTNGCDEVGPVSILLTASMQDGSELSRREMQFLNTANALVVGTASIPGVPTASETTLLILALVLALGGALVLKR